MTRLHKIAIALIIIGLAATNAAGQHAWRGRLKPAPDASVAVQAPSAAADTLTGHDTSRRLRLSGYDKPLTATRETVHATNIGPDTIVGAKLTITYTDTAGRMLHRRSVAINSTVPPGETRMLEFPAWDRHHSFYYRASAAPRRQATAYDIAVAIDTLYIIINNTTQR